MLLAVVLLVAGWATTLPVSGATSPTAAGIAAGTFHTCARLSNGNVSCWGENQYGQADPYLGGDAVDIVAGWAHTCARRSNGNVHCWGNNVHGQADPYLGGDAVGIAAGGYHTCARRSNGNIECWGNNINGQAFSITGDTINLTAGELHTCALLLGGNVYCWGDNAYGQANGYTGGNATGITAGAFHTCVLLLDGNVHCWGDNWAGQANAYTGGNATSIAAGYTHTCALVRNGHVACWGDNTYGQASSYAGGDAIAITARHRHTCALLRNGNVHCWGDNASNQLASAPSAPQALTASSGPAPGEITLGWQAPASEGSLAVLEYRLYRSPTATGTYALIASMAAGTTTYKDTGLSNGTTRFYYVTAVSAVGEGASSSAAGATTYNVPSAPRNVSATGGSGQGEITITWDPPASDGGKPVTAYHIYRATSSSGPYVYAAQTASTSWIDAGLGNGVTRHYRIRAVNVMGESPQSDPATATTLSIAPSAPQSLTAETGGSAGQIHLSWQPPADDGGADVVGYELHAADASGGAYALIATPTTPVYLHDGLADGATWHYQVRAVNSAGTGAASNTASATTLTSDSAPQDLQATPGLDRIFLHWEPPIDQETRPVEHYRIYKGTSPTSLSWAYNVSTTSFVDDTEAGQMVHYQVSAVSPAGEGPRSQIAHAAAVGIGQGSMGERSLLKMNNVTLARGVSSQPTEPAAIVTVRNHSSVAQTCIDVTVPATGTTQNVACWSQLIPGDEHIPRGQVSLGGTAERDLEHRITITAAYGFDPARLWEGGSLANDTVRIYAPVSPADLPWWTGAEGAQAGLRVHVLVWNDEGLVEAREVFLPHVGQALAAVEFSAGTQR